MKVLQIILDVILFADCIAAVGLTVYFIYSLKKYLAQLPPYAEAAPRGKVNYKLSGITQYEITNIIAHSNLYITEEMEYEAYRQAKFNRKLLNIMFVNLPLTVIAALCCCFDGFTTASDTLPATFVVVTFVAGFAVGVTLNFVYADIAYQNGIVSSRNRWTGFLDRQGHIYRYGRLGDTLTFGLGIISGWLLSGTVSMAIYTVVVMCL
ncbi:MAG: hypothetical protein LUD19_03140 [Clostridia bacterium]|nr:hypothetical protein [Clostridia bacterium]